MKNRIITIALSMLVAAFVAWAGFYTVSASVGIASGVLGGLLFAEGLGAWLQRRPAHWGSAAVRGSVCAVAVLVVFTWLER